MKLGLQRLDHSIGGFSFSSEGLHLDSISHLLLALSPQDFHSLAELLRFPFMLFERCFDLSQLLSKLCRVVGSGRNLGLCSLQSLSTLLKLDGEEISFLFKDM